MLTFCSRIYHGKLGDLAFQIGGASAENDLDTTLNILATYYCITRNVKTALEMKMVSGEH